MSMQGYGSSPSRNQMKAAGKPKAPAAPAQKSSAPAKPSGGYHPGHVKC